MMPSATDLQYFLEVSRLLNLSRAAESLDISQPSLTLAMRRIEEAVGTNILIRHKRGVSLTKAGKQLLAHTRQLFQFWDHIKTQTLASVNDVQGFFSIGCHPSIALYSLSRFLTPLLETYPKLEIKLLHNLSRKITEQVINLSIDIGIVVNPVKHPDLVIKKLDDDKVTLWKSKSKYEAQDLTSNASVLLCDPELTQTQEILKKLKKQGINPARIITSNNLEVIADLTEKGSGVGILPGSVAAARNITRIPKAPFYNDEICLLYRGENRNIKALQVIAHAIKNAFNV